MLRSSADNLEPLVALAVASNVIQIIGFSLDLIALYRDISKGVSARPGASFEIEKFEIAFHWLDDWSSSSTSTQPASLEETELYKIAWDCHVTAGELQAELNKLKTSIGSKKLGHKLEVLGKVILTVWNSRTMDKMHDKFQSQRSALNTALLMNLT